MLCWEESRSWVSTLRQKGYSVPWVEEPKGDVHNQIAGIEADLLLVDLTRLPEKGKEMVSELASKGALKNLPVILVSQKPNASHGLKGKVGALTVTTPAKIISAVRSALSEK